MKTYEEVIREIDEAAKEAVAESDQLGWSDAAHELAVSALHDPDLSLEVRRNVAQFYLGWDVDDSDEDLFERSVFG